LSNATQNGHNSDDDDLETPPSGEDNACEHESSVYPRRTFTEYKVKTRAIKLDPEDRATLDEFEPERPRFRGDCLEGGINAERPCPWATCAHHLSHQVVNIKRENVSALLTEDFLEDGAPSCALDVADLHDATLADVGRLLGVSREMVRQIENKGMRKVRLPMFRLYRDR
jgi:hypothetical protein